MKRAILTAWLAAAAVITAAPAASAGTVHEICAQDLYVRTQPAGVIIGTLYRGDHFELPRYSPSGDWAEGYAMGHVNQRGWIQAGWFCGPSREFERQHVRHRDQAAVEVRVPADGEDPVRRGGRADQRRPAVGEHRAQQHPFPRADVEDLARAVPRGRVLERRGTAADHHAPVACPHRVGCVLLFVFWCV